MTDDTQERICRYCGKPTTAVEFLTLSSGRVWAHPKCVLAEGKAVASSRADDLHIEMDRPDGITEISTGKQLPEKGE